MTKRSVPAWALALALAASAWPRTSPAAGPAATGEPALEPGDLVFQTSRSAQSSLIQRATASPWSHVGIVDAGPDGPVVIEAIGKVSRTPWRAWRARGQGGRVLVLRPRGLPPAARARAAASARTFLGRPYDARFGWSDDRVYCSELVVKAYARGAGLALGKVERLGALRIAGLERALEARWGGPVPRELRLVTPASVAADTALTTVYEQR